MRAHFLTDLHLRDLPGKYWQLTTALIYYSALLRTTITVPAGFVTDLASVPRVPLAYWFFGARGNSPAAIHDWLYRTGIVSRIMADRVFNEALKAQGKWFTTRWPMTGAVMTFGWMVYSPRPGCLDIRDCRNTGPHCVDCGTYYPGWSGTIKYVDPPKGCMT